MAVLQQIMKDRWINTGFEEDGLKPYTEPELDITDQKRIGKKKKKKKNIWNEREARLTPIARVKTRLLVGSLLGGRKSVFPGHLS